MSKLRKYSKEFKEEAVKLVRNSGKTYSEISGDLSIPRSTLALWMKGRESLGGESSLNKEEIKALRKENLILKEEREILKKALAIFSGKK
ncbi:transposase [Holosporaceae bacterium 'Namur']|nr:transposase [Holosporaceae bacterium 'Namur']